jgi:hypothetical protein
MDHGRPSICSASKGNVETVRALFYDLRAGGLGDPLLVVSDGVPGSLDSRRAESPSASFRDQSRKSL